MTHIISKANWENILNYIDSYIDSSTKLPTEQEAIEMLTRYGLLVDVARRVYHWCTTSYSNRQAARTMLTREGIRHMGGGYKKIKKKRTKDKSRNGRNRIATRRRRTRKMSSKVMRRSMGRARKSRKKNA